MIDLIDIFWNYDDSLLDNMAFEIRINNCKKAILYDLEATQEFIDAFDKRYDKVRWFILSCDQVIVFDFYDKEVCNE